MTRSDGIEQSWSLRHARRPPTARNRFLKQIDFVVAVYALLDRSDAFETHAGIDAGFRERRQRAVGRTIELRKHEIPELDETIAVLVR